MASGSAMGFGLLAFFVICVIVAVSVYFTNVACSIGTWAGSNCPASPASEPAQAPAPAPAPAMSTPPPPVIATPTGIQGGNPPTMAIVAPPPAVPVGPNVIGMAYQFDSVQDASGAPQLWFQSNGSCNVTVRVRGTSLTMPVTSSYYTNGDVYVKLGAPYTGTLILEKTDGTQLASKTLNNESSTVFAGAAHN